MLYTLNIIHHNIASSAWRPQHADLLVGAGLPGHFAGEEVQLKLGELHGRWASLKAKAGQRRQDLEDSLQAQQYFADANEAESWMREKEPIVGSPDYGKDEDSAEVPRPTEHGPA